MLLCINRCENGLMSFVNMKNCIRFYQTAEEIQAELLKNHCSELISNHWVSWKRVKKKKIEKNSAQDQFFSYYL